MKVGHYRLLVTLLMTLFLIPAVAAAAEGAWIGSWYGAPRAGDDMFPPRLSNATLRTAVRLTIGGGRLRLLFSNLYGREALHIGAVHVAKGGRSADVTFGGHARVTVPPGKTVTSDAVNMELSADDELEISAFYPTLTPSPTTFSMGAEQAQYLPQLRLNERTAGPAIRFVTTNFLNGIEVWTDKSRGAIVAVGDSITEGGRRRWPGLLGRRLAEVGKFYGVLNAGIAGNRLLGPSTGSNPTVGARFEHDALNQPGAKYVILSAGINDMAYPGTELDPSIAHLSAEQFEAEVRSLASRAHARRLTVYVTTITPYQGASSYPDLYSDQKNRVRMTINDWLRSAKEIDGYIDFDRALSDPDSPDRLNRRYDSGDHVHPNDEGERALSDCINLSMFQ